MKPKRNDYAGLFWAKVDKSGECWEWTGARNAPGYGLVARKKVRPYPLLAHRYAWELVNGPIPPGRVLVCHRCDTPPCVRPDHLFLGTDADNMRDMIEKGRRVEPRHYRGQDHPSCKVDDATVREARYSYAAKRENQTDIALRLGVTQGLVSAWLTGRIRPEAGGPLKTPRPRVLKRKAINERASA